MLAFVVTGASAALVPDATVSAQGVQQEDPCRDREPTVLDRHPAWRCVGLARFLAEGPRDIEEPELTAEQIRLLNEPRPGRYNWGVAVAPDGRLYQQVKRIEPRGIRTAGPSHIVRDAGEANEVFFSILGADDRTIRTNTTAYPWRALTALLNPGSDTSNCSGTLIGPRHVLTAGHCIYDTDDNAWIPNRKVAPGMNGIGTFPNKLKNHVWYWAPTGWWINEDANFDYAIIILEDKSSTANLGYFGWRSTGHSGGAWNFGYPGWWRTCAASPSPPQCSNFLYGDDGAILVQNWGQLGHTMDTQPGQSGSPVYKYNDGDRRVIAVHAYGKGNTDLNWGTRIRSAVSENLCNVIATWPSAFKSRPPCY